MNDATRIRLALQSEGRQLGLIDKQTRLAGFIDHPPERDVCQTALCVAAADVGMDAGEPELPDILPVVRLRPEVLTEEAPALVDRDGVPARLDRRVVRRE